ncbi:MAG TPA: polymer-forming cytoskeletal protein, partial [Caldilineaceae bacterium]|nr:polymer-forming cytoskeletal protein [Caldilineaceae bacterium]
MRSLLRLRLHHRLAIIGSVVGLVIAAWLLLPAATRAAGGDGAQLQTQFGDSVFTDNLTVPDGMVYKNDVVVVSGNATVEHGGRIEGNLNVLSGNVAVEEGGEVEGDISAVSGNISVAGKVGGDIAAFSGNVELQPTREAGGRLRPVSAT